MIGEGTQLLVVGLGVVFLFLGLLVLVLHLLARVASEPPAVEVGSSVGDRQKALVAAAIAVAALRTRPARQRR